MILFRKTVIVTGASSGIGRATALAFARAGANVVLAARSADRLNTLASEVEGRYGVLAMTVPTDITREDDVYGLVNAASERFGSIDILINNAGRGLYGSVSETPVRQMREMMDVNWWGSIYAIQAVVPHMKRQGSGLIMNVTTMAVFTPVPYLGIYSASKAALRGMSRTLRHELAASGVQVSTIYPGLTESEFSTNTMIGENQPAPPTSSMDRLKRLSVPSTLVALRMVEAARNEQVPNEIFITTADRLLTLPVRLFDRVMDFGMSRIVARLNNERAYAKRET